MGKERNRASGKREGRQARLAAALRQNMKRRKAQARARTSGGAHDSAGFRANIETEKSAP